MKYILVFLILVGVSGAGYLAYKYSISSTVKELHNELLEVKNKAQLQLQTFEQRTLELETQLNDKQAQEKIYRIVTAGDMMLDRGVESRIKNLGKDYNYSFELIRDELHNADYVFANLEGSISSVGTDTGKPYSFRFEPAVAKALASAGIDLVSLANNHMLDWGRDSLCATTHHLTDAQVTFIGAGCTSDEAERPIIVTLGNTRIAFLAYTEFYKGAHATQTNPGFSEYNLTKIQERISHLKEQENVDLVFVSMHWGEEYKPRANNFQVETGYKLIDMGADVIIGHHPHVDQEIERYKNGWIIYSLGNFVFDQSWSEETMQAIIANIYIQNKRVYDISAQKLQINSNFQPYIVQS